MTTIRTITRGSVIAAAIGIVAASVVLTRQVGSLNAQPTLKRVANTTSVEPTNRWLDGLTAKHKQFFDAPTPNGGIPLVHVMNYYDTYNKAFGVKDADVDAVLTFYGATTFYGLSDACLLYTSDAADER